MPKRGSGFSVSVSVVPHAHFDDHVHAATFAFRVGQHAAAAQSPTPADHINRHRTTYLNTIRP